MSSGAAGSVEETGRQFDWKFGSIHEVAAEATLADVPQPSEGGGVEHREALVGAYERGLRGDFSAGTLTRTLPNPSIVPRRCCCPGRRHGHRSDD
jgi:hypothetical protein